MTQRAVKLSESQTEQLMINVMKKRVLSVQMIVSLFFFARIFCTFGKNDFFCVDIFFSCTDSPRKVKYAADFPNIVLF